MAGNVGIEKGYSSKVSAVDCDYFTRSSASCILIHLDNKDLVTELNKWVDENGYSTYRKWEYKTVDGYACPVLK